jgi:hypothetical protein
MELVKLRDELIECRDVVLVTSWVIQMVAYMLMLHTMLEK